MNGQSNSGQENDRTSSQVKQTIMEKARMGTFDHNPLLSTTHIITCHTCSHRQSIIYLDYLKSGEFQVGKAEQIEVLDTSGPIGFLEMERVRSIVIHLLCEECGSRFKVRPVSTEYLQTIINGPKASGTMYV